MHSAAALSKVLGSGCCNTGDVMSTGNKRSLGVMQRARELMQYTRRMQRQMLPATTLHDGQRLPAHVLCASALSCGCCPLQCTPPRALMLRAVASGAARGKAHTVLYKNAFEKAGGVHERCRWKIDGCASEVT